MTRKDESQRFSLTEGENTISMAGRDVNGTPFSLVLDRVWAGNLVIELTQWLEDADPKGWRRNYRWELP